MAMSLTGRKLPRLPVDPELGRERAPLEGCFVEITFDMSNGEEEDVYNTSKIGWAVSWSPDSGYLVDTLGGNLVEVADKSVKEFEPTSVEEGGFDLPWPPADYEDDSGLFSVATAECLQRKGYCVLQAPADGDARLAMYEYAHSFPAYTSPKVEFQEALLGRKSNAKVGYAINEDGGNEGLMHYNGYLKKVHESIMPVSEEFLSMTPFEERMRTMIRTPFDSRSQAIHMDTGNISEADVDDGIVEDFIDFIQRRKLCVMYMVTGGGGSIELHPRADLEMDDITINNQKDRLLIFRHDMMSYTYKPEDSEDLVLQSWIVDPPKELNIDKFSGEAPPDEQELEILGPPAPSGISKIWTFRQDGATVFITSFHGRIGGEVYGDGVGAAMVSGIDSSIEVSRDRWDPDIYYGKTDDLGKTRTKHSCFLADHYLQEFDYRFFEWTEEEARDRGITARLGMEVPYCGLVKAGLSREDLRGQNVEFLVGWSPGLDSQMGYGTNMLLPYYLGTTGKNALIDTACSAALVAVNAAHGEIAMARTHMASVSGINICIDVGSYIALSGARMISDRGRSFTFDQSGNGYGRGEGIVQVLLESSGVFNPIRNQCKQKEPWELNRFVGSATNQDGRSASITAPSGPAQTACIRKSLVEAMIDPPEVTFGECHGTGTALGDPIEVGSARIVNDPYPRDIPYILGATKTHFGHLELGAGIIGLLRAIVVLTFGGTTPNANLYQVNEHMSLEGFPHYMSVECAPFPFQNNIAGVNSFGFGGTNARAELWGRKTVCGPYGTMSEEYKEVKKQTSLEISDRFAKVDFVTKRCPRCLGLMHWVDGLAIPSTPFSSGKYHAQMIRSEGADYDVCSYCYDGEYEYGGDPPPMEMGNVGQSVFFASSSDNWYNFQEMTAIGGGQYTCAVRLGDSRMEEFRLSTTTSLSTLSIHPVKENAPSFIRIEGPDKEGEGKNWLIDGRADGSMEGQVYRIVFEWASNGKKKIWWEPTEEMRPVTRLTLSTYSIVGTWSEGRMERLIQDESDPDTWVSRPYYIGRSGKLSFYFVRNGDEDNQAIYPAAPLVTVNGKKSPVQVNGPDNARFGRSFEVHGASGEKVSMSLHVADAAISVTTSVGSKMKKVWESVPRRFVIAGTWSEDNGKAFLEPDSSQPGVHRGRFRIGKSRVESFQVLVNGDPKQVLFPEIDGAMPGESIVVGPSAESDDKSWQVAGPWGVEVEVMVCLKEDDSRHLVLCKAVQ